MLDKIPKKMSDKMPETVKYKMRRKMPYKIKEEWRQPCVAGDVAGNNETAGEGLAAKYAGWGLVFEAWPAAKYAPLVLQGTMKQQAKDWRQNTPVGGWCLRKENA